MQSWKTAQKPIRPRSTRRSRRTTNCGKFSRTWQRNTGRVSAVTVSSRKCDRWMMRKLCCWQPTGNSYPCKVGSINRKLSGASLERDRIETEKIVWKSCKNESRLIRNWKQPTLNRYKPNMRWRCWWLNRQQKMQKLSIKEIQGFSLARQDPSLIKLQTHRSLSVQIRSLDAKHGVPRCFGTGHGGSRKSARLWHRQCGHWKQGSRPLNLVPRRIASSVKWWARMKSSPMEYAYVDSAKWTPKDKMPQRGACQTPSRKRCDWLRLWISGPNSLQCFSILRIPELVKQVTLGLRSPQRSCLANNSKQLASGLRI